MLFDLTDLRLFIHIAESGSLTRAAERMHLSLGAASNRIKELESRFGMRLLYRENKGVQLSPAGETLLIHAQQFMQQLERMKSDMQQFSSGIKGHIRIFANTTGTVTKASWPVAPLLASTLAMREVRAASLPMTSGAVNVRRPPAHMRRGSGTGGRKPPRCGWPSGPRPDCGTTLQK